MNKTIIETKNAPAPIGPYSQAVKIGNLLFISGQIGLNPESGNLEMESLEVETHQVMKNIKNILSECQLNFGHVVKTSIFLRDLNDFNAVNEIYSTYFEGAYPARECVEVSRLPKDVNVEISIIAGTDL